MSAAGVRAELVAPVANMLAAAVAAGRLVSTTAGIPTRVASGAGDASAAGGTSAQAKEVEVKEVEGERADEGTGHPLGPDRGDLCAAVHAGAGPRAHRVHDAPIRPGRGGHPVGLGRRRGRGDRRRPGGLGALGRGPGRVQGFGRPGVSGRDRRGVRVGDLPAGPVLGGPVPDAGAGPPHRHPGHRRRWDLRPGRLQRPSAARVEGDDERGRAAPAGRSATSTTRTTRS